MSPAAVTGSTRCPREPAEQLGDTAPGAFDQLPPLRHPAIEQAADATRLPVWALPAAVAVVAIVSAWSYIAPLGLALQP